MAAEEESTAAEEESAAALLHDPTAFRTSALSRAASFPSQHPLLLLGSTNNSHLLVTRHPRPPAMPAPFLPSANGDHPSLDEFSVFPPDLHEGLHVEAAPEADDSLPGVAPEPMDREEEKVIMQEEAVEGVGLGLCLRRRIGAAARRLWGAAAEALCSGREGGGVRAENRLGFGFQGIRFNVSVAAAAAAAVTLAGLVYARRRDRRERDLLVMLLQEKDQRIAQLLQQIAFISNMKASAIADAVVKKA